MARMARSLRRYLGYPTKKTRSPISTGGKLSNVLIYIYIYTIYPKFLETDLRTWECSLQENTNLTKAEPHFESLLSVYHNQLFGLRMLPAVDVISRSSQEVKASLAPCSYENEGIPFHSDDKAKKNTRKNKTSQDLWGMIAFLEETLVFKVTEILMPVGSPTSKRWMIRTNDSPKSSDNLRDENPNTILSTCKFARCDGWDAVSDEFIPQRGNDLLPAKGWTHPLHFEFHWFVVSACPGESFWKEEIDLRTGRRSTLTFVAVTQLQTSTHYYSF